MCNREKLVRHLKQWCMRLDYVKLMQFAQSSNKEQQEDFAAEMERRWKVDGNSLAQMTFSDLLFLAKNQFQNIGVKYQSLGLRAYIDRNLSYLTKSSRASIPPEVKPKLQAYLDALSQGKLSETDLRLTKIIASGSLKHDAIARVLVPSLLQKADKVRRGKHSRLADRSSVLDPAAVAELGFCLGHVLQLPHVQSAFGLARASPFYTAKVCNS